MGRICGRARKPGRSEGWMYTIRATRTGHCGITTDPERMTLGRAMQMCRRLIADSINRKASWVIEHRYTDDDGVAQVVPVAVASVADGTIVVLAEQQRPDYAIGGPLDLTDEHHAKNPTCGVCAMQMPREMVAQTV